MRISSGGRIWISKCPEASKSSANTSKDHPSPKYHVANSFEEKSKRLYASIWSSIWSFGKKYTSITITTINNRIPQYFYWKIFFFQKFDFFLRRKSSKKDLLKKFCHEDSFRQMRVLNHFIEPKNSNHPFWECFFFIRTC